MNLPSHLATIRPLPANDSGRVLALRWNLLGNACLILMPLVMIGIPMLVAAVLTMLFAPRVGLPIGALGVLISLAMQITWAWKYPEWPMNRWLYRRLLRAVHSRGIDAVWVHRNPRMVEFVPRENWGATKLETAEDVMLIHVDRDGVHLEGDVAQYVFPAGSIIDVAMESIRPAGCFHSLHFVVLIVRTERGPIEFPLSYRDHGFGQLSSRVRRRHAVELCQSIAGVATGGDFTYQDPAHETMSPPRLIDNPFAAPRSV